MLESREFGCISCVIGVITVRIEPLGKYVLDV